MNTLAGLRFATIDLARHADTCLRLRREMFVASFGTDAGLEDELGPGGGRYLEQLAQRIAQLPEGNAHLWEGGSVVAQTEMSLLDEEHGVGYVHLFFVEAAHRGRGLGRLLHQHAAAVFTSRGMRLMRLSVANCNEAAIAFYRHLGWRRVGPRPHRLGMDVMECAL